jgi:DNA primase
MHVDFAQVRAVPIEAIIRHYGWEGRRQGNCIVLKKCPLPSHSSKELHTFKVGVRENLWRCWSQSCRKGKKDGGDVIDLVCEVDGLGGLDAAKKLAELFAVTQTPKQHPKGIGMRVENKVIAPESILSRDDVASVSGGHCPNNKPLGFMLQTNPEHEAIQSRGISIETAKSYGVGYYHSKQGTASMDGRIIFPLHENGVLVGYIGRAVEGEPKWKMGKGVIKSMLFGLDRCDPSQLVVITESAWAVLWLRERGIQAASLLGTQLTEGQEKAIAPFRMLSVALDNDDAGREATEKIMARLRANHAVKRSYFRE